jgi:hypothetical protein
MLPSMQRLSLGVRRLSTAASASAAPATLRISEVFASIQGEGPWVGRPSVFMRLGLCNLECAWCDTKFTVPPPLLPSSLIPPISPSSRRTLLLALYSVELTTLAFSAVAI